MRRRPRMIEAASREIPRVLALGPCVEVWGGLLDGGRGDATFQARRQWKDAKQTWLQQAQIEPREGYRILPARATWSLERLSKAMAGERFARVGCTPSEVSTLRREALELITRQGAGAPTLKGMHRV